MKRIVALLLILWCGTAFAASYPEIGSCTGTRVRLREDPGTEGRILGLVEERRHVFVLLGEVWVDGQIWYEIEHPTQKGTAYISAQYVNYGWYYGRPTGKEFVKVRQMFGIFPEKAEALLGKARKDEFGNLNYPGLVLRYDDESMISQVQVEKRGIELFGIQVGDKVEKLFDLDITDDARGVLEDVIHDLHDIMNSEHDDDEPVEGPEGWGYANPETGEEVFFGFGLNDKDEPAVEMIIWSCPRGEG